MANHLENTEIIDRTGDRFTDAYRDPTKIYSAHDKTHLLNVAKLTELVGLVAGYSPKQRELARICAWLHDLERSMNELERIHDESESAEAVNLFAKELRLGGLYPISNKEQEAISYAILENGHSPEFFAAKPDPEQWTLPEKLLAALFTADKMDANGHWIIARRSQFVAGARFYAPDADLPKFGLQPDKDKNIAVLLETLVRIVFVNPEGVYPPVLRPLTSKLYRLQRDFAHGLLAAEGMSINDLARLCFDTKLTTDPLHPNYLEVRDIMVVDANELAEKLHTIGGLSDDEVKNAQGDLANSAMEAVAYFSDHYERSTDELVKSWQPSHNTAKLWLKGMKEYASGEWFRKTRAELTRGSK